jgi:hypothetical protein
MVDWLLDSFIDSPWTEYCRRSKLTIMINNTKLQEEASGLIAKAGRYRLGKSKQEETVDKEIHL